MPFYIKLIRWYYISLVLLAVLAPLNYSIWRFLPSFFLIWLSYVFFKKGCKKGLSQPIKQYKHARDVKLFKLLIFFVIFMMVFIPLYVRFYTGGNLTVLAMGFYTNVGTDSNYQEYQRYFLENNLNQFTIDKLPYIVGYGLAKLLFYFFVFSFVGYSKIISKKDIVFIAILFLLYSMVGMARGTNFENFELLILIMFTTLVRSKILYNSDFYSKKQFIKIGILLALIGFAFLIGKSLRSGEGAMDVLEGPTSTLAYDGSSLIMSIMPIVGKLTLGFSGYFTFGLYFTSELFWKIWSSSIFGVLDMLIPLFASFVDGIEGYREELTARGVDSAVCWDPDIARFSFFSGLPLLLVFIYYLGIISGKSYNKSCLNKDAGHCIVLYIIVYEMISLPIGNFLVISSANKIMLFAIIYIIAFDRFKKYRFR